MNRNILIAAACAIFFGCSQPQKQPAANSSRQIDSLFKHYYDGRMKLFPLEATQNGDNRFNNLLPNNITVAFRNDEKNFFQQYLDSLNKYDRSKLNYDDQMSYDVLKWE